MRKLEFDILASGHRTLIKTETLSHFAFGTYVVTNLEIHKKFLETSFAMECVIYAPGQMVARDRRSKYLMENGYRDFFVLFIKEVDKIDYPQSLANHWGVRVEKGGEDEVKRLNKILKEHVTDLGLKRINPSMNSHGSYSFYSIDQDSNWFEHEYTRGKSNDIHFSEGDCNTIDRRDIHFGDDEKHLMVDPKINVSKIYCDYLNDDVYLTHGTHAVKNINNSRKFYEEILGLRTVRQSPVAMSFAGAADFVVVGLSIDGKIQDQPRDIRFGIILDTDQKVQEMHDRIKDCAEEYGLLVIEDIVPSDLGGTSFCFRSMDQVWFEISSCPSETIIGLFNN